MERWQWAAVAAVLAIALGAGAWFGGRPPTPPPVAIETDASPPPAAATVTVHVSGAVARAGLVDLAPGSRVADALAAAGGALPSAEIAGLNLAAPVSDGQQIAVPVRGGGADRPAAVASDGRIRINSATASEIEQLPGVGPVTAERIVTHREEHGPFVVVEDLLDVPGIGEGKLAALRDAVIVP